MSSHELFNSKSFASKPAKPKRRKPGKREVDSSITYRKDADGWRFYTVGACGVLPAGSRLLKGQPWPIDRFVFNTEEETLEAAQAMAKYHKTKFKKL